MDSTPDTPITATSDDTDVNSSENVENNLFSDIDNQLMNEYIKTMSSNIEGWGYEHRLVIE